MGQVAAGAAGAAGELTGMEQIVRGKTRGEPQNHREWPRDGQIVRGKNPRDCPQSPELPPNAGFAGVAQVMAGGVTGSVSVALHPLVILNISDHWIRLRSQEGRNGQGEGQTPGTFPKISLENIS